jgi:HAD superfamily phosphoserine phosphatase-like hydrolase
LIPTQTEIPRWTALEFERLVLSSNPKVAVFDCDGTLWNGDSGFGFMEWSLKKDMFSRSTKEHLDLRYRAYMAGKVSEVDMCGEMVQIYAGLSEDELRAAAALYVSEFLPPRVFAEMAALVTALNKAGVELWAVSSTNKWVVAEGARHFGIPEERVLAAEVRVTNGILTREIVDVPTDEYKAAALQRVGLDRPDAVFGNSVHDLAMLEIARNPFPVNPSPGLLEAAAKNGWGYFQPEVAGGSKAAVPGESALSGS